jgi:hypothetical protein
LRIAPLQAELLVAGSWIERCTISVIAIASAEAKIDVELTLNERSAGIE